MTKVQRKSEERVASTRVRPRPAAQAVLELPPSANSLLHLQGTYGNRYVQRWLNGAAVQRQGDYDDGGTRQDSIQAKLTVSKPSDPAELEADRVAEEVLRLPAPDVSQQVTGAPTAYRQLQRSCAQCEEELHRQPTEEEEMNRAAAPDSASTVAPAVEAHIAALRGSGEPLLAPARNFFEPRFGRDFSQVRVHTDARAAESAKAVNALAFTVGRDVVFGAGQYAPGTSAGDRLLAHELTHVVQQAGGSIQPKLSVSQPGDPYEREADQVARENIQTEQQSSGETDDEGLSPMAGEPTINVTQKAKSLTKCGSAEYKVKWSVSDKKKSGWVIQHIKFKADVSDDKGTKKTPSNADGLEYWEGWQVSSGKIWVGFESSGAEHNADTFRTVSEGPKTKGTASITGKVRFMDGYDLKVPPWGSTVPEAGALPTIKAKPDKWDDASADDHTMKVNWDCTGATETQTVDTTP